MMDGLIKGIVGIMGVALFGGIASSLRSISDEEKQYLPTFSKGFRGVLLWFLFTTTILIYSLIFTNFNPNGESPKVAQVLISLFVNRFSPWFALFLIILFIITIGSQRIKFFIRTFLEKDRKKRKYKAICILLLLSALFIFFTTGYCTLLIQIIFTGINEDFSLGLHDIREVIFHLYKINQPIYHIFLFAICVGYSLLILLMRTFYRSIYFEKISINIHLKNGFILEDKYIINNNLDNGILIADSFKRNDPNKTLIPKANIELVKFNRVDYSFGEKKKNSNILYKEEEMKKEIDDLVKQWRKNQNKKHSNF